MANKEWCRHYNGLSGKAEGGNPAEMSEGRQCMAMLEYRIILKDIRLADGWPCCNREMAHLCASHEPYTEAEIANSEARTAWFLEHLRKFDKRETEDCPQCGQHVDSLRQVGRCVYASPCNCRIWQGKVPVAWR